MSKDIYNLFIVHNFREAYYQMSPEQQETWGKRMGEIGDEVGAKQLLMCDTRWSNEAQIGFGVEVFPDLAAVQRSAKLNTENLHYRYLEPESILGTALEGMAFTPSTLPDPLYLLMLFKNQNNEAVLSLPPDLREGLVPRMLELARKNGGQLVLGCDCDWSAGDYANFGILAWPGIQAEQEFFEDLARMS